MAEEVSPVERINFSRESVLYSVRGTKQGTATKENARPWAKSLSWQTQGEWGIATKSVRIKNTGQACLRSCKGELARRDRLQGQPGTGLAGC